jgi:hypothetical protein
MAVHGRASGPDRTRLIDRLVLYPAARSWAFMGMAHSALSECVKIDEQEENKTHLCVTLGEGAQNCEATVFKEKSKSFSKP